MQNKARMGWSAAVLLLLSQETVSGAVSAAPAEDAGVRELARGKNCKVFSARERGQNLTVSKLTDGDTAAPGWRSGAFASFPDHTLYPEFVILDLGASAEIERVVLHSPTKGTESGKGFPEDFTIQVCEEGEHYKVVLNKMGHPVPADGNPQVFKLGKARGRYVMINATRLRQVEPGCFRFELSEIEVYGRAAAKRPLQESPSPVREGAKVTRMECGGLVNPIGVDVLPLRLSWWMDSAVRGQIQTAYRVIVASDEDKLGAADADMWDSGKVTKDEALASYSGKPLLSSRRYWWKVMLWDKECKPTEWSTPAYFQTGILAGADWKGQWIAAGSAKQEADKTCPTLDDCFWVWHPEARPGAIAPPGGRFFRKRMILPPDATWRRAVAVATADNSFELYVNGLRAFGSEQWQPPVAADVRTLLHPGENILAVRAVNGPDAPNPAGLIGKLEVVLSDGKTLDFPIDKTWKVSDKAKEGWQGLTFDDSTWPNAVELVKQGDPPWGKLAGPEPPMPKSPAVYMRKEFVIAKAVKSATAFFCGLGYGELYIDGVKVGKDLLTPGFTDFDKRVQYVAYDVTDRLQSPGRHAVGAILGNGWYSLVKDCWVHEFEKRPYVDVKKLLLNVHVEYTDGSEETLATDASWKWNYGEITDNTLCSEDIDKRLALGRWSQPGYDASAWKSVLASKVPKGTLQLQQEPATRQLETIKPQRLIFDAKTGAYAYEFGREFTGWVKFRTSGPRGTEVNLKVMPAKSISPHHGLNHGYHNKFTLAGTGVEEYVPRFQYNNVCIVYVSGVATPPKLADVEGCMVAADLVKAGGFSCSDPLVNWLHGAVERTQRNYVTYLPNDPTREKKAWTQDAENMFLSSAYLFDSRALYARWQDDIIDGQKASGNLNNMAPPELAETCGMNSPWWGGVGVWLPWEWYQMYGDSALLTKHYEAMKRYVDFCDKQGPDGIQTVWGLTDWISVEGTSAELVNTTATYRHARILEWTAKMMGKDDDQTKYAALAEKIKKAFNARFLQKDTGKYAPASITDTTHQIRVRDESEVSPPARNGTQAGQALALQLGLVPEELRPKAQDFLLKEIAAHEEYISSGFVATTYLLQELTTLAPEIGYRMTTKREQPSWYAMTAGTDHEQLQEFWTGRVVCMPSLGGPLAHWNFQALGGICPDPEGPGFKKMILRPNIVGELHWVEAWYDSPHGRIVSNWRKREGWLTMTLTVPANTTATVYVPAGADSAVTESGKPVEKVPGIRLLRREGGTSVFAVGSGTYQFAARFDAAEKKK
jgi:alpha-L-rhamnosidase